MISPILFTTGCEHLDGPDPQFGAFPTHGPVPDVVTDGTPEIVGMLRFLNDPITTRDVLDYDVELDSRAATGLINHRNGLDGRFGTPDDDPFDSLLEVQEVRWVGDVAIEQLVGYASSHGWVPAGNELLGVFEGVTFTADEAESTLTLVNTANEHQLDEEVGLDRRAVEAILAARPLHTMPQLAQLPHVGAAALEALKAYAVRFLNHDQSDSSFVLTPGLAAYYLDVMTTVLRDDRDYFEDLATAAGGADDVDRILIWIEVELEREIEARVGQVFPSEQDLLDELFGVLETLQERGRSLLLN